MRTPTRLLKRHVLESNAIESIRMRTGAMFGSHLRAALLVAHAKEVVHPLVIHKALCRFTPMESFGGTYREGAVYVGRSRMPEAGAVPELMEWLWGEVAELHTLPAKEHADAAVRLHDFFLHIHPFQDGNGRTARLFLNSLRLRHGLPWHVIEYVARPAYYRRIKRTERIFREHFPDVYLTKLAPNPNE